MNVLCACVCLSAAFEITIDHPHTHVVKCTQLVRGECGPRPHIASLLCEEHLDRLSMFLLLSVSLQPVRTWLRRPTSWPPTGSARERHCCRNALRFNVLTIHSYFFSPLLSFSPWQPPPDHLLSAVQPSCGGLRLHPPCLQVVQLGNPSVDRRQALVGVCGRHGHPGAAGRYCSGLSTGPVCKCSARPPTPLPPILLPELTHEFLQILEKTPSRLKRIRNWKVCSWAPLCVSTTRPPGHRVT